MLGGVGCTSFAFTRTVETVAIKSIWIIVEGWISWHRASGHVDEHSSWERGSAVRKLDWWNYLPVEANLLGISSVSPVRRRKEEQGRQSKYLRVSGWFNLRDSLRKLSICWSCLMMLYCHKLSFAKSATLASSLKVLIYSGWAHISFKAFTAAIVDVWSCIRKLVAHRLERAQMLWQRKMLTLAILKW